MLSNYRYVDDDGVVWYIVTYQRNEHSEIETLYEGHDEDEQMRIVKDFLEEWA